jgi:hypothetical protein
MLTGLENLSNRMSGLHSLLLRHLIASADLRNRGIDRFHCLLGLFLAEVEHCDFTEAVERRFVGIAV